MNGNFRLTCCGFDHENGAFARFVVQAAVQAAVQVAVMTAVKVAVTFVVASAAVLAVRYVVN